MFHVIVIVSNSCAKLACMPHRPCFHDMPWTHFRRQRERLIHLVEADEATVGGPAGRRRADPDRMIKSFQRSAAGRKVSERRSLRPPPVLLQTVNYIFRRSVPPLIREYRPGRGLRDGTENCQWRGYEFKSMLPCTALPSPMVTANRAFGIGPGRRMHHFFFGRCPGSLCSDVLVEPAPSRRRRKT